jgi:hypothetical protein
MEGFDPSTSFGYDVSKRYDAVDTRGDEEQTVGFLARLAGQRDALEFAVGTGRIALPLAGAGVRVDGIEMSRHMVDRMREKPDGNNVEVTMGDMFVLTPLGSISVLTLPADNDTWSVTLYASATDAPTRRFRDPEVFARVLPACPLHAHWLDGDPIGD